LLDSLLVVDLGIVKNDTFISVVYARLLCYFHCGQTKNIGTFEISLKKSSGNSLCSGIQGLPKSWPHSRKEVLRLKANHQNI